MKKFIHKKNINNMKPSMSAQILSAFAFAAVLALAFAADSTAGDAEENFLVPKVHARWKRSLTTDLFDTAEKFGIGGSYLRKFKRLLEGTPPTVKEAFIEGDFSNITENDIKGMNVSVLEFVPPSMLSKISDTKFPLIMPFIQKFLDFNRPNALGRLMSVVGDKFDTPTLINQVKEHGGIDEKNEAAGVLLYSALNKIGDKDGITIQNLKSLASDNLLDLVPEEQLMKVKDSSAAKYLLNEVYSKKSGDELDDVDDKALIFQLANAAYGKPDSWTSSILKTIQPKILSQLPASSLKSLSPEVISESISIFRNTKLESPLQGKAVTDSFLQNKGLKDDEDGAIAEAPANMGGILSSLGNLAAFVSPSLAKGSNHLGLIMNACDKLNLPAPFQAVTRYIKSATKGKSFDQLGIDDVRSMGISVLKNGPPELVDAAVRTESLSENDLREIGNVRPELGGIGNSFLQGIISQVAGYAVKYFTRGGKIDFGSLPGAFLGALGIKGVNNIRDDRDLDDALAQLKKNPDAMDDAQKALLLKRLKESGKLDNLPPELRAMFPRKSTNDLPEGILDGLPSDSELRLAHGSGKKLTAADLSKDPLLIGTMTPQQAKAFDLSEIPSVLAAVRRSRDGPQPQTLKALAARFREYIQQKSEDYESEDKKLLKHISAAEVSKLPASVLAYFVDPKQTGKLPADVRKEIMIALGELSTKDHAGIPSKTRNEIILQGLAALDQKLDKEKKLGVPELAAIGAGVVDLPPTRIESLTPVAVEQALEIVNGMSDEDDDGLKQRACLSPEQKKAWGKKLVDIYGDVETWDPATVSSLCCSLALLEEDELVLVPRDSIMSCRCPVDDDPPSHLKELKKALNANCKHEAKVDLSEHKKTLERVKSEALDLDDLESQIISGRRRKRDTKARVNCYMIRLTGSPAPYEKEDLETLPDNDIHNCLYELGKEPLSKDVARVLWDKLVKSKGGVEGISSVDYTYAGHLLSGIRLEEISKLNVSDPDVLSAFGRPLGLSKTILEKIAHLYEDKTRKSPADFTSADLVAMKNVLCGFSPTKLRDIKSDAFIEALPVLKELDGSCELTRVATLAETLTREEIYGDVSKWTSADVRGAGILFIGLSKIENIPPESFLGITPTVAAALPESVLSSLTAEQLSYFPRFSAQTLSEDQLSKLSGDAKNALDIQGPLITASSVTFKVSVTTYLTMAISAVFAQRIL